MTRKEPVDEPVFDTRIIQRHLAAGRFVRVEITHADGYDLEARVRRRTPRGKDSHDPIP